MYRDLEVATTVLPLDYQPGALAGRDPRGRIQLVAERTTKRLLGAHILAPEGADAIQTAALAIKHGMTYIELAEMIFPYLTTVEGLKLAAQTFETDVRSEEHTSELQSLMRISYAVFCLKKKKN